MIFVNGDLDLYFQDQLIWHFCCRPQFYKTLVKVGHIIAQHIIQHFLQMVTLTYIFKVIMILHLRLLATMPSLWSKFC